MQSPRTSDVISKQEDLRPEEVEEQLSKILSSRSLGHSTVLQSFLRYVTEETVRGRAFQVSEYTIATQALGRGADFDSSSDTIVRTQAYRLRQKLSDYYASEGLSDSIRIEIPKGHYIPSFTSRASPEIPEEDLCPAPASVPRAEERTRPSPGRTRHSLWVLLAVLACGLALGFLLRLGPHAVSKTSAKPAALNSVDAFWHSFLQSDREPIIAYTNSLYLISNTGDQIAYTHSAAGDRGTALDQVVTNRLKKKHDLHTRGDLYFEDSITGVGDVLAATSISNAVIRAGGSPLLKRGRLLSTYDLQNHNVIFIGSPFVNQVLNDLPARGKFIFKHEPLLWTSHIDDTAPEQGRVQSYKVERAPENGVLLTDYAVVSCLRGLNQNRHILVIAGLTTSGTAAAAELATSLEGVTEMSRCLHRKPQSDQPWPRYFELLIKAQLSHGIDVVHAECVATHSN